MVSLDVWLAFLAAVTVLNFMPGPSMMLVIAHALAKGARAATGTVAGIVVGDALLIVLSLFGIGALLAASAQLFLVMKWLGVVYLVCLGIAQWRSGAPDDDSAPSARNRSASGFAQGVIVTLFNPKVIAFHVAFFPQFLDPRAEVAGQMVILGGTFLVLAAIAMAAYAVTAGQARRLSGSRRLTGICNKISGATLIGAGLLMASFKRA